MPEALPGYDSWKLATPPDHCECGRLATMECDITGIVWCCEDCHDESCVHCYREGGTECHR